MQLAEMVQSEIPSWTITADEKLGDDPRNYKVSFTKAAKRLGFFTVHEPALEVRKIVSLYNKGVLDFGFKEQVLDKTA